jgi:hypothetical protein
MVKYKTAGPFTGGSAALRYSTMKSGTDKPTTLADIITEMEANKGKPTVAYTLPSGSETYTSAITPLTTANSPVSVVIDGGGRVVLDNGAVIRDNAVAEIRVSGGAATAKGTLKMKMGALVTYNHTSDVTVQANGVFTMSGGNITRENISDGHCGGVGTDGGSIQDNHTGINGGGVGCMAMVAGSI